MQYKTFVIESTDAIALKELNNFLVSKRVIEVIKHFVATPLPTWHFCVQYLQQNNETTKRSVYNAINYQEVLSKEVYIRFERLRVVRKQVATEMQIPAYAVFSNKELSEIASLSTISIDSIKNIEGIGKGKIEKVGERFIQLCNEKSQ